jgi:hypothetical protein
MKLRRIRLLVPLAACLALGTSVPSLSGCSGSGDDPTGGTGGCCRVCRTGQPCGDACIAKGKTCNSPRGCACDG